MKIDEIESIWESEFEIPTEIKRHLETECKYRVYLDKQEKVILLSRSAHNSSYRRFRY